MKSLVQLVQLLYGTTVIIEAQSIDNSIVCFIFMIQIIHSALVTITNLLSNTHGLTGVRPVGKGNAFNTFPNHFFISLNM